MTTEHGEEITASGLLFVGDLHLSSKRPGRRKDDNYAESILKKLNEAVDLANARNLVMVLTGDIFHEPKETSEVIKTLLLRTLGRLNHRAFTNVGNHDKTGTNLDDGDTLAVVTETGWPLQAMKRTRDGVRLLLGESKLRVGLGFTPSGQDIPRDVTGVFEDVDAVAWVTHHDIQFERPYPNSMEPFEIEGCSLVVNGHMHLPKNMIVLGQTQWCNFGSLARTAIDAIDHAPSVWSLVPGEDLEQHFLKFEKDVFDLTGRLIPEVSPGENQEGTSTPSLFVEMLSIEAAKDPAASPDGLILLEDLEWRLKDENIEEEVAAIVVSLHQEVTRRSKAAA